MIDEPRTIRFVELAATLLLAFAAVSTAWAGYQSSRWHGKQALAAGAANGARLESTRAANVANRQIQIDVAVFSQWVNAYAQNQQELEAFYRRRFRPAFVPAFDAWVATHPRTNADAPLTPFAMRQYRLPASAQADRLEAQATAAAQEVRIDIQRADNYTLAVVLFAVSLFFAGISTRLGLAWARAALVCVGWLLFLGTATWLATLPVTVAV